MKPNVRYILASLLALSMLFLTSCQTAQQVDPDSYKIVLSSTSPETENESEVYYGNYQSETAAVTKTVTFLGKEYTGEYEWSAYRRNHKYPMDIYAVWENGQITGRFFIHANTGRLAVFSADNISAVPEIEPSSETELDKIARFYASIFASLDGREMTKFNSDAGVDYLFTLYINGCPTEDVIRVYLQEDGTLHVCEAINIGMFSDGINKTETDILHPETCEELIRQHCENPVIEISNLTYRATFSGKIYVITKLTLDDGESQYYQPMLLWVEWKTEESASGST